MIPPFPLYVDEISPDKIKATVSNSSTIAYNLRIMSLDMPLPAGRNLFNTNNGIHIMPIGKFICMLVRDNGSMGMIILDLIGKTDLAEKMAGKLNHVDLHDKFMYVYTDIIGHPENHRRFKLVLGPADNSMGLKMPDWGPVKS